MSPAHLAAASHSDSIHPNYQSAARTAATLNSQKRFGYAKCSLKVKEASLIITLAALNT